MELDQQAVLEALGRNIKTAREQHGWSQEQLGIAMEATGPAADRGYISLIENGRKNISATTIVRIAHALDTTAAGLLDGVS